jgi:hypothetical protein
MINEVVEILQPIDAPLTKPAKLFAEIPYGETGDGGLA